jgi:hypothetical protein
MPNVNLDTSILQAALEGLERRREQLEEQIRTVRGLMRVDGAGSQRGPGRPRKTGAESAPDSAAEQARAPKKRRFSAAVRKRLAEAMRQRWAVKRTAAQARSAKKR